MLQQSAVGLALMPHDSIRRPKTPCSMASVRCVHVASVTWSANHRMPCLLLLLLR